MMSFRLWPVIVLLDGQSVHSLPGGGATGMEITQAPGALAWRFRDAGFRHLHVQLDQTAEDGADANWQALEAILYETDAKVHVAGLPPDPSAIDHCFSLGASRVVLSLDQFDRSEGVIRFAKLYPERIVLDVLSLDGLHAHLGADDGASLAMEALVARLDADRLAALIYREPQEEDDPPGEFFDRLGALAHMTTVPVLAGSHVLTTDDLDELSMGGGHGAAGALLGQPLYEGLIDPMAALSHEGR